MDKRLLEPDVLYVRLSPEPLLRSELAQLREQPTPAGDKHLVLDFSHVEIMTSPSIGHLLLLQKQLAQGGRRLMLYRTRLATRCIFRVAGLDALLDFAEELCKATTLAEVQNWLTRESRSGQKCAAAPAAEGKGGVRK